jgi:hypothetical protein
MEEALQYSLHGARGATRKLAKVAAARGAARHGDAAEDASPDHCDIHRFHTCRSRP